MHFLKYAGVLFVAGSIFFLSRFWKSVQGHEVAKGTVTELVPTRGNKGTTYRVVAQFTDVTGTGRIYRAARSSNPPSHQVGDEIRIMYDPQNPDDSYSLSFGTRFGLCWVMLGIGLLFLWIYLGWRYGDDYISRAFPYTY